MTNEAWIIDAVRSLGGDALVGEFDELVTALDEQVGANGVRRAT